MADKSLEQVLEELKQAEKEYKEKCLKYGIEEKIKHKKKDDENTSEMQNTEGNEALNKEEETSEN